MNPSAVDPKSAPPAARRTWLAIAGLVVCLAGCASYVAFMGNAFLRATGASGFLLLAVGIVLGWVAVWQDQRRWLKVLLGLDFFLLALYGVGLFGLTRLPATPDFDRLASPPDFTLSDQAGQAVKLSDAYASGPVLLVFYRGFW